MQLRGANNTDNVKIVQAKKEIIMAAGSLHTPQILQRSGIGPSSLLNEICIKVLVDLPGVGGNLQDHPVARVTFNCESFVASFVNVSS
jgi:choline dehydrogenase-like flavoprotein